MADYTSTHTGAAIDVALDDIQAILGLGSSKNITSTGIIKIGVNPSAGGQINVNNGGWFKGRNAANSADISMIRVNSSDEIQIGDGANVTIDGSSLVIGGEDALFSTGETISAKGALGSGFVSTTLGVGAIRLKNEASGGNLIQFYDTSGVPRGDVHIDSSNTFLNITGSVGIGLFGNVTADGDITLTEGKLAINDSANETPVSINATNASFSNDGITQVMTRASSSSYTFLHCVSGLSDSETIIRGDGNNTCDGAWTGGGADYAEWFEWADGNPDDEDRVGYSVTMIGNKVSLAVDGDVVMGVVSGSPAMVGDGDIGRWKGKYLTDDFGRYIMEPYQQEEWTEILEAEEAEILDDDGEVTRPFKAAKVKNHSFQSDKIPAGISKQEGTRKVSLDEKSNPLMRRKLNPAHVDGDEYVPRSERKEWSTIGLVGKLRLRDGQPVDARWIKMRDISENVEEWLVR